MHSMLTTKLTEFLELKFIRRLLFIFGGRIIFSFALGAIQTNDNSHNNFL